jgi:hypothetical protein
MTRVRRIGVISLANIVAAITFVMTLFFVVLLLLVVLPTQQTTVSRYFNIPTGGAVGFFLIVPFIYAALGWIGGALSALVYNLVASFTGGVQLQLEHRPEPAPPVAWSPVAPVTPTAPAPTEAGAPAEPPLSRPPDER